MIQASPFPAARACHLSGGARGPPVGVPICLPFLLPKFKFALEDQTSLFYDERSLPAAGTDRTASSCERDQRNAMLLNVVRIVYAFVCAGAIAVYVAPGSASTHEESPPGSAETLQTRPQMVQDYPLISAVVLFVLTQSVTLVDVLMRRKRIEVISAVYFGLLIGVLLTYLLMLATQLVIRDEAIRSMVATLSLLILPYLCISMLLQTKDDFRFVIPYVEFARELKGGKPLVLDSSALIDGRISDLVDTNILDSELVIPQFVLREVQDIADSNEKMRRSRGRRGLDVLSKLQNNPNADVRMHETDQEDAKGMSVDQRLIELAKQLRGRLVTSDFNLNKVATVQGIPVVNLNDVSNSLKPRYLPGERLTIKVLREGESPGQGVGYLDDGTMVVCEQAAHLISKEVDMIVTTTHQTSAGRMIFARQVHSTNR